MYEFIFLVFLCVVCVALDLLGKGALLTFVVGCFTFAVGALSFGFEDLPFKPYFNLFVLLVGVLTMLMASRFRGD